MHFVARRTTQQNGADCDGRTGVLENSSIELQRRVVFSTCGANVLRYSASTSACSSVRRAPQAQMEKDGS